MRALVILGACILVGCSPKWHIDRAIRKDPTILHRDTITLIDTVRMHTERTSVDSVFMVSTDTVIIHKDNLTIRHYIHNDSVYVWGECDTIWMEKVLIREVPVDRIIYPDDKMSWGEFFSTLLGIGCVLIFAVILYKFLRHCTKPRK